MRTPIPAILLVFLTLPLAMHARVTGHFDRTLQVSGAVTLDLTTGSGDVQVKTGSGSQVIVHGDVSSDSWFSNQDSAVKSVENNPPIQQSGGSIRIGYNLPEDAKHHVSISYVVTVPPDTTVTLNSGSGSLSVSGVRSGTQAHTGSGDIRLSELGGKVQVQSGSGGIRAENVSSAFSAGTGSGSIEADLSGSGDVDVHSGSGSIRVKGATGGLRARTGSGDIEADGNVKGPWQVHTGSGSVRIAVGTGNGLTLNVHTSSGSIHSNLPVTVQGSMGHNELKGAVNGGGPEVEVSTGSGDITVQ